MKIEVLGAGCQKCQMLLQHVDDALTRPGLTAEVVKVQDPFDIAGRGVNRTPAIIVDGQLKLQGRVATVQEIVDWIQPK